jgi:hypothetical protein
MKGNYAKISPAVLLSIPLCELAEEVLEDQYISEITASRAAVAQAAIGGLNGLVGSEDAEAGGDAPGASLKKLWPAEGRFSEPSPTEKEV